jgi:hypothetical protein
MAPFAPLNNPNHSTQIECRQFRRQRSGSLAMHKQITRISILQSSKIATALYVLMGFIYTLIGVPLFIFGGERMKIMAIVYILMPVIMAIFGFIFFAIFAAVYNLLAKWLGGFEVEVTTVD